MTDHTQDTNSLPCQHHYIAGATWCGQPESADIHTNPGPRTFRAAGHHPYYRASEEHLKVCPDPNEQRTVATLVGSESVLQPWVATAGLKMQSILLSGLRSPDHQTRAVKKCVRWLRSQCQIDADPSKQSYMQSVVVDEALIQDAMTELEYCTVHYAHHFADSFRVVAEYHPDAAVRATAWRLHFLVAEELLHFKPESFAEFEERHRDKR